MRFRAISLLLVAALSLTGCVSAREVPPPISDAEQQTYLEKRLDAAWLNTGLEGIAERPESDPTTLVARYRDPSTLQSFNDCTTESGFGSWSSTERDGGPQLIDERGGYNVEATKQLSWYTCFSLFPSGPGFSSMMLSRQESGYLYDYYRDWLVPCLAQRGYSVGDMPPTREQFIEQSFYVWIPYYSVTATDADPDTYELTNETVHELAAQCGDPFPGMPYGEQYGF